MMKILFRFFHSVVAFFIICLSLSNFIVFAGSSAKDEIEFKKDSSTMRLIPTGTYTIGSDSEMADTDESPAHSVKLLAFYIDKYEVTNSQYRDFLQTTGHREPRYWTNNKLNQPDQPVVGVSWDDATAYTKWAGKRLPTEAEWEASARGKDNLEFPWGNTLDQPVDQKTHHANVEGAIDGFEQATAPVGSFPTGASSFGVHDLAGNVFEWVADWYAEDYYANSPMTNPLGPEESATGNFKVLRGGSWLDPGNTARSAKRSVMMTSMRSSEIGFRCAISLSDFLVFTADPWDVNKDGNVDIFDLVLVASNFGRVAAKKGDVNNDGNVDVFDLVLVANHFGQGTNAAPNIFPKDNASIHVNLDQSQIDQIKLAINQLTITQHIGAQYALQLLSDLVKQNKPQTRILASYPNPFNPETWVPFHLEEAQTVNIGIYSTSGELVRLLSLGQLPAGVYINKQKAAYWDGKNEFGDIVASGIYFAAFQSEHSVIPSMVSNRQGVQRMILVK